MKLSATTVSIPDLDVEETCKLLADLGYDGVEWRVRFTTPEAAKNPFSIWGAHKSDLSPDNLLRRADELIEASTRHGLEIAAIASNLRADQLAEIRVLAEGVAALGPIPLRIDPPMPYDRTAPYSEVFGAAVQWYSRALEILAEFGLKALVEIHGGRITVSASLAHRLVANFSPERIGVIYDINNMAKDGFETFRIGLELLGPYLAHCHAGGWRPVAGDRGTDGTLSWDYEGCDLSDTLLDVPQFIDDLKAVGYRGFVSIEDFRPIPHRDKFERQASYLRLLLDQAGN